MKPKYTGLDLYNAICTVKAKKYRVTTIYDDKKLKMIYMIECNKESVHGEFLFSNNFEKPVSYTLGFAPNIHVPIDEELSYPSESKENFLEKFITFRLTRL